MELKDFLFEKKHEETGLNLEIRILHFIFTRGTEDYEEFMEMVDDDEDGESVLHALDEFSPDVDISPNHNTWSGDFDGDVGEFQLLYDGSGQFVLVKLEVKDGE
jgi:hypothetical protein